MTSLRKWPFWTHPTCQTWLSFTRPPHPLTVTSFIVHEVYLKFYGKFYMECKIEFDGLGLKYKERFNKSLTVVFEIEISLV